MKTEWMERKETEQERVKKERKNEWMRRKGMQLLIHALP